MSSPFQLDPRGVLIDKLGENSERFQRSNLYFKNTKGLNAIYEIKRLRAELYDFAKDPSLKDKQLPDELRPRQPDLSKLTEQEQIEELEAYRELVRQYETAKMALKMQVPVADMFAIEQYMEPFDATIDATPAVKGRRFHAFTKQVEEEQRGLFGMGAAKKAAG